MKKENNKLSNCKLMKIELKSHELATKKEKKNKGMKLDTLIQTKKLLSFVFKNKLGISVKDTKLIIENSLIHLLMKMIKRPKSQSQEQQKQNKLQVKDQANLQDCYRLLK